MTNVIYKDSQFQTEDGICFEDQELISSKINGMSVAWFKRHITDGSTYSIRERVAVKHQIKETNVKWVGTHELMYSRFPEDRRRIVAYVIE